MRLYLDDDSISAVLVTLLRRDGHDVVTSADAGMLGKHDAVHLAQAIDDRRILLSHNHNDFEELHELVMIAAGHHPGILIVRRDNDPKRDLTPRGVAVAVGNLEQSQFVMTDQFQVLNKWR
jgi:predicted nuclease of predicted toxin-antitoxin system